MIKLLGYFFGIGSVLALIGAGGVGVYVAKMSEDLPAIRFWRNTSRR